MELTLFAKILIYILISYTGAKIQAKRQKSTMQRAALLWNQSQDGYDSSTYGQRSPFPRTMSTEGKVINMVFGKCRIGSTIIRASSPREETIKVHMAHNDGLIDDYLAYLINNVEFSNLRGGHVQFDAKKGTMIQEVSSLFPDDGNRCAYAGIAYTGWKFFTNKGEVKQTPNVNVIVRGKHCYDIGQDEDGGTRSFTRNPAQVLWNFYTEIEHYATEQLNTNAFTALETMCNSYPMGEAMPLRPPGPGATSVKGISFANKNYLYWFSFDKDVTRLGHSQYTGWRTAKETTTNQRFNIDLGAQYIPTKITIENHHDSGTNEESGIKNFSIFGSNSKSGFETTSYGSDAGWTLIQSGFSANSHSAFDVSSSQTFTIVNSADFRYLSIKMADNHGGNFMGVRDIQFWGHSPKHTFDYNFDKKTTINDALKRIWASYRGMTIWSQGQIKPVWDGALEHDGSGGLTAKTVKHAFSESNIEELVSWGKAEHPNVVRVYFIDCHDYFKTTFVEDKDDKDIEDKGEIIYEEECYWITERDQARQRVRFLKDKFKITDYVCALRAWPDSQDVEVYDLVTITHTLPGWTTKEFLVTSKRETQQGTSLFELEAYHSGIYHDGDFIETENYSSSLPNPDAPPPSSTGASISYVTTGTEFSYGSLKIEFTPPEYAYYSYTDVFAAIASGGPYAWVGKSDGDDIYFNGLGVLYQPGNTVYIKLRNVNANGTAEPIPDNFDASLEITGALRLASWYLGTTDMWAGNATIGNAGTVIVIGDLDGTPKIALGASADSIDGAGAEAGFYADGGGNLYVGNQGSPPTEYFKFDGTNISWATPTSSLDTAGKLTTTSADIGGWDIVSGYIYSLQSGTPTASPNDGLVLASANAGMIIYEDEAKRFEAGYLSSGVYGIKAYASDGTTVVMEVSDTQQKQAGWLFDDAYFWGLASGTPTATPNDGIVLASGSTGGVIVYEDTVKRTELGYLSAGVYGLKGYATDGSTVIFELSDTQQKLAGWLFDDAYLWGLASGTGASNPSDGIVLKAGSAGGVLVYEDTAKRVELGYLSAGVYGLKGYATDGTTVIFELSDTQQKIGGWIFTDTTLSSQATGATQIILNADTPANQGSRISIMDTTAKIIMGYLDDVVRNNAQGTASGAQTATTLKDEGKDWKTNELAGLVLYIHLDGGEAEEDQVIISNTADTITVGGAWDNDPLDGTTTYEARYTEADYGFWAKSGDYLQIDGDVDYVNGDWLIQHDAAVKMLDGSGNEIIRLGTYDAKKGLFLFNTGADLLAEYTGTGLTIKNGGDIVLNGDNADPGLIIWDGNTRDVSCGTKATGTEFGFWPDTAGTCSFLIGWEVGVNFTQQRFNLIDIRSNISIFMEAIAGPGNSYIYVQSSGNVDQTTLLNDAGDGNTTMQIMRATDVGPDGFFNWITANEVRMTLDYQGDLTLTENIFLADTKYIGIDSAERIEFRTAGYVSVMGANFGVGVLEPVAPFQVTTGQSNDVLKEFVRFAGIFDGTDRNSIMTFSGMRSATGSSRHFEIQVTDEGETVRSLVLQPNGGNVGIQAPNPTAALTIGSAIETSSEMFDVRGNATGEYIAAFEQDSTTGWGVLIETDSVSSGDPALEVRNDVASLFYVDSNGSVGVGKTPDADVRFDVIQNHSIGFAASFFNDGNDNDRFGIRIQCGPDDTSADVAYFTVCNDGNGNEVGGTRDINGTFGVFQNSDILLKTDVIVTETDCLSLLNDLKVYDYNHKRSGMPGFGFVANQMQEYFPQFVAPMPSGMLAISDGGLMPYVVKSIQQGDVKAETMKSRITELESEVALLKAA